MPDKEKILAEIKKTLKPFGIEKIILFGSFAYGKPNENSDIDLLVIKNIPKNETRDLRLKLKKALWLEIGKYNIPFDLLVDNDERIKKRIEMGDLFYKEIYLQGKVIYA
jgi:predicted nucleotidyltransferase